MLSDILYHLVENDFVSIVLFQFLVQVSSVKVTAACVALDYVTTEIEFLDVGSDYVSLTSDDSGKSSTIKLTGQIPD